MKIKSSYKTCFSTALLCAVFACSLAVRASAAAEDKSCTVNDTPLSVGDVFIYTLDISDVKDKFSGIDISIYYDPEALSLNSDKISLPVFKNAVFNSELDGEIRFNAIDVMDGYDFTKGNTVISADFTVLDTAKASTNITFSIRELYDMDTNEVKDYKTSVSIKKGEQNEGEIVKPQNLEDIEKQIETQYGEINSAGGAGQLNVWIAVMIAAGGCLVGGGAAVAVVLLRRRKKNADDNKFTKN